MPWKLRLHTFYVDQAENLYEHYDLRFQYKIPKVSVNIFSAKSKNVLRHVFLGHQNSVPSCHLNLKCFTVRVYD